MSEYSGIILAGGDGTRLAPLTRRLAGDGRPKQFCRLIGDDTLLGQTRRRARVLIAPERLLTVVTRHHERSTCQRSRTLHRARSSRSQRIAGQRRRSCTPCRVSLRWRRRIRS
jgi:mannose-1-phosphate guanylyltransferase